MQSELWSNYCIDFSIIYGKKGLRIDSNLLLTDAQIQFDDSIGVR